MRTPSSQRTLKQRAVALLARREHSRAELAQKLTAHGTQEEIEDVLNQLQSVKLLSDARFTAAFVRSRSERFGGARLRQELKQRGVATELVEHELAAEELPSELDRARTVWHKKFSAAPADAKEWAKQARFLQGRGFGSDVIRRLLKDVEA